MLNTISSSRALKHLNLNDAIVWSTLCIPFPTHRLPALHCTLFPFGSSSWVHTMLWCQASSRAAAVPNRREWGRRGERKWQTRAGGGSWGQLKIVHRRGGESDGESAGTTTRETQAGLYLGGLRMKCFAVRRGEARFSSWAHGPPIKPNNGSFWLST